MECYECEGDECTGDEQSTYICEDAAACWKSTVRDINGTIYNNRGCINNPDHLYFMCGNRRQKSDNRHLHNRLRIECCTQNMCNGGAFPLLPDPTHTDQGISPMMLTIAILIPPLTLGLVFFVIMCYRRCTRNHSACKRYEQNSSNVCENSTTSTAIASGKNLLINVFFKFTTIFNRFSTTHKCKVNNFNENEQSSDRSFMKLIP